MTSWRQRAWRVIEDVAAQEGELTADDVLDRAGHPDAAHGANGANNAIGALFRDAAKAGLIVATGRVVKSRQSHRKGGIVRVWVGVRQPTLFDQEA